MPDQLLLYDTHLRDWIENEFDTLITGKNMSLMIGTPDRAFAEYVTPTALCPDGRPPLPRVAITIEDPEEEPERFNSNDIRKLGLVTGSNDSEIYRAEYPVPVRLPYTLNFWTEYRREMNLYVQKVLKLFRFQYKYIPVDIDSISPVPLYGTKDVGIFIDSSISNTGDTEPGTEEVVYRRTVSLHMKAWLWDFGTNDVPSTAPVLKDFQLETYRDRDLTELLEVARNPQRQILFTGTGAQVTFSGTVNSQLLPIIENTLLIDATVGGNNVRGFDDGAGSILGTGINSGTVDYVNGTISITYDTAPDLDTPIEVCYFTREYS